MISAELKRAARVIQNGGIVAYATEYCFGFGCDPMNRSAVLRLLHLKRRAIKKGVILIAADVDQLAAYISTSNIPSQVLASWPGPHTWLLAPRVNAPRWITGEHARIAVRVTAHAQAAALCQAAGMAIVSTSANRAGDKPVRSFRDAVRRFKTEVDYVLPGRVGKAKSPTPIRDAIDGQLIRPG